MTAPRCPDLFGLLHCERPAGHDGFHRFGDHTWAFRDTRPEWLRRLHAKELTR